MLRGAIAEIMFKQRYNMQIRNWKWLFKFASLLLLLLNALSKIKRQATFTGLKILRKMMSSNFDMEAVQQHLNDVHLLLSISELSKFHIILCWIFSADSPF